MFPWEAVLGIVMQLVTSHKDAAAQKMKEADAHAAAATEHEQLATDLQAMQAAHNPDAPADVATLQRQNDTLTRALKLMIQAREMFK